MNQKPCDPINKTIKGITCDMRNKIHDIQANILLENPNRVKVSETEAIFKAIHEYHKIIKQ